MRALLPRALPTRGQLLLFTAGAQGEGAAPSLAGCSPPAHRPPGTDRCHARSTTLDRAAACVTGSGAASARLPSSPTTAPLVRPAPMPPPVTAAAVAHPHTHVRTHAHRRLPRSMQRERVVQRGVPHQPMRVQPRMAGRQLPAPCVSRVHACMHASRVPSLLTHCAARHLPQQLLLPQWSVRRWGVRLQRHPQPLQPHRHLCLLLAAGLLRRCVVRVAPHRRDSRNVSQACHSRVHPPCRPAGWPWLSALLWASRCERRLCGRAAPCGELAGPQNKQHTVMHACTFPVALSLQHVRNLCDELLHLPGRNGK